MNKKKTYILIIAMLLVLAVSAVAGGLLLWSNRTATEQTEGENKLPTVNKKDEDDSKKEQTYKILVKNAEGSPIQGILAAFYDKAGNVVGEPGTTNNMGAITLKTEETNIASAKVLAVPYEYELNKEFHEFKASKKSVSIVLNENPNAYVAQIPRTATAQGHCSSVILMSAFFIASVTQVVPSLFIKSFIYTILLSQMICIWLMSC